MSFTEGGKPEQVLSYILFLRKKGGKRDIPASFSIRRRKGGEGEEKRRRNRQERQAYSIPTRRRERGGTGKRKGGNLLIQS